MSNVFIMKNDGSLLKVATINDRKQIELLNESLYESLSSVTNFNKGIINKIVDLEFDSDEDISYFYESEDIMGFMFYKLNWRRCSGYMVLQKSSNGVRYLCYLIDVINHQAQSFGTSVEDVEKSQVIEFFKKKSVKLKENNLLVKVFGEKLINNIEMNLESNFGL